MGIFLLQQNNESRMQCNKNMKNNKDNLDKNKRRKKKKMEERKGNK